MFFIPFGTREHYRKARFAYITLGLLVANVAVFAYEVYIGVTFGEAALASFLSDFAAVPSDVLDGTPLEMGLFTSMFLHAGLLHIASNMIFLLPFGDNVEDRLNHGRFLLFYLLCGLIATATHIAINPNSDVPVVGASGAIAGVLAGYLVLFPKGVVKGLLIIIIFITKIELPAIIFIGFWFVTQLFSGVASFESGTSEGGVAFWAHIGGFAAGLILAPLLLLGNRKKGSSAT